MKKNIFEDWKGCFLNSEKSVSEATYIWKKYSFFPLDFQILDS